ncbi:MAG: helix-turn-helix domain-containing protein [Halodesulfurarchaeum sp.]
MAGIRAELSTKPVETCPVARLSEENDVDVTSVSWTHSPDSDRVTEECTVQGTVESVPEGFERVFTTGSQTVYRFERSATNPCPCELLEEPIVDVHAEGGTLRVTVDVENVDVLRSRLDGIRSEYPSTSVDRVGASLLDEGSSELVLLDVGSLTARQREVIETAFDMGYFDHPKEANAGDVAAELDITTSTFTEHLAAAQSKLLSAILED